MTRDEILASVREYYKDTQKEKQTFQMGDRINYAGRNYDEQELEKSFWVGVHPGLTEPMLEEMVRVIHGAVRP